MKIDVITLNAVCNYGSVLQALATQELFKVHGCDIEIINYVRKDNKYTNLIIEWSKGNFFKAFIIFPTILRWKYIFGGFNKKYLNLSKEKYTSDEDFKNFSFNADAYCTGSDQVWNSIWNKGILSPLYLGFVPNNKYKFSFSASFGQTVLSDEEVKQTQSFIEQYKYISVREDSAVNILKNQYKFENVFRHVDPTIAIDSEKWRQYSTSRKIKEEYILIYNLNRSREFDQYAVSLSRKTGLRLVRLCTRYDQFYRPGKSIFIPKVFEFIGLIDNARYVLTDSFHATAFAMNMNTEPICIYPSRFESRLADFLYLTESQQRHVESYDDFDVINRPVDFSRVNQILDNERKKTHEYIDMIIRDIQENYENSM